MRIMDFARCLIKTISRVFLIRSYKESYKNYVDQFEGRLDGILRHIENTSNAELARFERRIQDMSDTYVASMDDAKSDHLKKYLECRMDSQQASFESARLTIDVMIDAKNEEMNKKIYGVVSEMEHIKKSIEDLTATVNK